jgi:hypothetical protein
VLRVERRAGAEHLGRGRERDRLHVGGIALARVDEAGLDHVLQHDAASRLRALDVDERAVASGRAREPGDERTLGQREVAELLAEVAARRRGDPVRTVAEERLVQIDLEDALLRQARLDAHREDRLAQLAEQRLLVGEEALRDLLRDRAAALRDRARAQVRERGASEPAHVEPAVLEEAAVLAREDRVHERLRDVFPPRVGSMLARELGEQRAVGGVDPRDAGRRGGIRLDAVEIGQVLGDAAIRDDTRDDGDDDERRDREDVVAQEPPDDARARRVGDPHAIALRGRPSGRATGARRRRRRRGWAALARALARRLHRTRRGSGPRRRGTGRRCGRDHGRGCGEGTCGRGERIDERDRRIDERRHRRIGRTGLAHVRLRSELRGDVRARRPARGSPRRVGRRWRRAGARPRVTRARAVRRCHRPSGCRCSSAAP